MLFKKYHIGRIQKGEKTETRRAWKVPRVKVGNTYSIKVSWFDKQNHGRILVTELVQRRLGDMTEADAKAEGGYSLAEYKEAFEAILKTPWNDDLLVWVVRFQLVPSGLKVAVLKSRLLGKTQTHYVDPDNPQKFLCGQTPIDGFTEDDTVEPVVKKWRVDCQTCRRALMRRFNDGSLDPDKAPPLSKYVPHAKNLIVREAHHVKDGASRTVHLVWEERSWITMCGMDLRYGFHNVAGGPVDPAKADCLRCLRSYNHKSKEQEASQPKEGGDARD